MYYNNMNEVNFMIDIKILVVDDVTSMRHVTKSILIIAEYTNITQATDGVEALELLQDEIFDLIICDWEMPQYERTGIINRDKEE